MYSYFITAEQAFIIKLSVFPNSTAYLLLHQTNKVN